MRITLVLIVFMLYTLLFRKAAGTLNLKQLNMISYAYYLTLVFCFIGGSLIFCGFREHYLVEKLTQRDIDKAYIILSYVLIVFPLTICFFNKLMGIQNMKKSYRSVLASDVKIKNCGDKVWLLVFLLSIICLCAMIYTFSKIGYFTLFAMFKFDQEYLAKARIEITHNFSGNYYIRNIIMLSLTPLLSYIAYFYMRITQKNKWKMLFVFLFILSIIAKTYNFEKSPLAFYIFYFYFIEVLLDRVRNMKFFFLLIITGLLSILFFYSVISGYSGPLVSLTNGPVARTLITQVATFFLHIQAFPNMEPFLEGASLPTLLAVLFDLDQSWIRSGRVVMELYNPAGIAAGTAGVMNSLFVAEAYANWGMLGVALSPVYLGFLFSLANVMLLKCPKTPLVLMVYLVITIHFSQALLGGFVDFLYSANLLVLIGTVLGVELWCRRGKIILNK